MGETQCSKARAEGNRSGPELSPHEITFHPAGCELEETSKNIKTWGRNETELRSKPLHATGYPPQLEVGSILSLTLFRCMGCSCRLFD